MQTYANELPNLRHSFTIYVHVRAFVYWECITRYGMRLYE